MNNIEAMSLALDALQYHTEQTRPIERTNKAIAALRQAISEAEQVESDVKLKKAAEIYTEGYEAGKHDAEQAEQEPVVSVTAMLDKCISVVGTEMVRCKVASDKWFMCQRFVHAIQDMQYEFKRDYTAPPKREWVSLTDDEVKDLSILPGANRQRTATEMAFAVDAKLKEKNCG